MPRIKFWMSFLILLIPPTVWAVECDVTVNRSALPLPGTQMPMCLDEYFFARDMGRMAIVESDQGKISISANLEKIDFDDVLALRGGEKLGDEGRLNWVHKIYHSFLSSLRNEYGPCELRVKDGVKDLKVQDFQFFKREMGGQPGSRLTLISKNDHVNRIRSPFSDPRWELRCPDHNGKTMITKSGSYFYVFITVYENIDLKGVSDHLAEFLFKFD